MSYDLNFWCETQPTHLSATQIRDRLYEGKDVEGLAVLDEQALWQAFSERFPTLERQDFAWDWEGEGSFFLVWLNIVQKSRKIKGITVSCGSVLLARPNAISKVVRAAQSVGCTLYDPQVQLSPQPRCRGEFCESLMSLSNNCCSNPPSFLYP